MTAKILYASPVVEQTKQELAKRCAALKQKGVTPHMCVVLVGDNPASLSYIRNKKKMCEEIGAKFELVHLEKDVARQDFLSRVEGLNKNSSVNGIIIQLPVSEHLRDLDLPNLVVPKKDIDGFHGENTHAIYLGTKDLKGLLPCTPKGVLNLLKFYNFDISGKNVVIIGRSLIVGKPLSMLMSNFDATVTLAHSKTKNLKELTKKADIVVAAIGRAHFVDRTFFEPKQKVVVIDVGMNSLNGKLVGDVHFQDVLETVDAVSPAPGGVGPMTVLSLIENLISTTETQFKG